ncbi:hypothetical protein L6164_000959 [Bauhinia variegata]|uniref:Uncharacterized protein n=1 Tax=Bauhinia variegata TaxID=167791 RepID=A0ACB9Q848_BAUVA|nr:hypothetical protein L6164_000959 [Bauhinia variegata]
MERFGKNFLLVVAFVVVCNGLFVSSGYTSDPSELRIKYLEECASKLTQNCADQLTGSVIFGRGRVTKECCGELVYRLGERCHYELANALGLDPNFKGTYPQILKRAVRIWKSCVSIA